MELAMYQVDAFTGRLFGGNPAAVVLLDEELPEPTMQAIATENNLSETAFVLPEDGAYRLRWFTPKVEVDLCGHATLGAAFVLFEIGAAGGDTIRFETKSGTLTVTREGDLLSMNFPSLPPEPVVKTDELVRVLGATPTEVHAARDLMAVFETQEQIIALRPDFVKLALMDPFAVMVTAPGKEVDFVSRFFAPKVGIDEDPVTGSAHCTLIPYWAKRLGKEKLHALQVSKRGGELFGEQAGDRVTIKGRAVEYLRGRIRVG
jgi:PhzF family phenazine biosynthesis protein